jgi:glycolate oxidase FAD binding subunit
VAVATRETPASATETAALLAAAAREVRSVRFVGGGTKLAWAGGAAPDLEISTRALGRIVEHNVGDLTASIGAGARVADVQARFAAEGQTLALDAPIGEDGAATVGGVLATGDSGPLRHRYGAPRDLVLGMRVALSDGTLARSGGKVIKNVAGYDMGKLFTGSFGSLGAIVEVVVRLHPLPTARATLVAASDDPAALAQGALALAHAPLELDALDVEWGGGRGALLARFAGSTAGKRAADVARKLGRADGLAPEIVERDEPLWASQRARQRSNDEMVVRVSGLPDRLEWVLRTVTRLGGSMVGRAGLGLSWLRLPVSPEDAAAVLEDLRRELAPSPCVVLDAPAAVRDRIDAWGVRDPALLALSRRVKERFDPGGICAPGVYPA